MLSPQPNFEMTPVLEVKRPTDQYLLFKIDRPKDYRFQAGQFARLGIEGARRAYSIVSAEYDNYLEFFAVLIPGGTMSERFRALKPGDEIILEKNSAGFLLPGRFVSGDKLVMLSTGSGIAPFVSQLKNPELYERFERIAIVHSVSHPEGLVFGRFFETLGDHPLVGRYRDRLTYIPAVTRGAASEPLGLNERIPQALLDGKLEALLPFSLSKADARFMVCGNPAMVEDTFKALLSKGYAMHRNRIPGEIILENGF